MSVNNVIIDGDFSTAAVQGPPRFSAPFDGDNTFYLLEQDYVISLLSFAPIALNTGSPDYANYFLVKESTPEPVGVYDVVKWTRTYAKIPASRIDPSTVSYRFIGYAGNMGVLNLTAQLAAAGFSGYVPGRPPNAQTVPLFITNEYFMVGTGGSYPDFASIPINLAQKYYTSAGSFTIAAGVGTFTPYFPPVGGTTDIANGTPTDYLTESTVGSPYFFVAVPTVPSRTVYQALVSAGSLIVVEDSSISRWIGNIYCRVTKKVVAR